MDNLWQRWHESDVDPSSTPVQRILSERHAMHACLCFVRGSGGAASRLAGSVPLDIDVRDRFGGGKS